jgi:hypothetical protein
MKPRRAPLLLTILLATALGLAAALPAALPSGAQTLDEGLSGVERLEAGRELYQAARFGEAQRELRAALERTDLSPRQRGQAWFLLGQAYAAQGYDTFAVEAFAAARAADPGLDPDPAEHSPRVRDLWRMTEPGGQAPAPPPTPEAEPDALAEPDTPAAPVEPAPQAIPARPGGFGDSTVEPPSSFRETPLDQTSPSLSDLQLCREVRYGRPVGVATTFAPQTRTIHLWFAMRNVAVGTRIKAVWSYLAPEPTQIVVSEMEVTRPGAWGQFSCQLGTGRDWPDGGYEVELLMDGLPAGRAGFRVGEPPRP